MVVCVQTNHRLGWMLETRSRVLPPGVNNVTSSISGQSPQMKGEGYTDTSNTLFINVTPLHKVQEAKENLFFIMLIRIVCSVYIRKELIINNKSFCTNQIIHTLLETKIS